MRIVMMALGTAGDVLPLTGLGARLKAAGHDVVLAAEEQFRPAITAAGLDLRPVAFGIQQWVEEGHPGHRSALGRAREYLALARRVGEAVVDAYDDLVAAAKDAEVLLVSYGVAVQGYLIAKAMGIPSMGLYLVPMTPT